MQLRLLAFAQARDAAGFAEQTVECGPDESARAVVMRAVPGLDLRGLRVAADGEYRDWDALLGPVRELALIPPVSGG